MALTIPNPSEVPPGGWVYRDPVTEFILKHHNLESLFNMATRHRSANGLELSNQDFINIVCASTAAGCSDTEGGGGPSLIAMAGNLITDMVNWAGSGFAMAGDDLLEKRRKICNDCEHWGGMKGGSLLKGRCKLCGCMGIKLALATAACPAGRWPAAAHP